MSDIMKMLSVQQAQLDAQKKLLDQQQKTIADLQSGQKESKKDLNQQLAGQAQVIDGQRKSMQTMQAKIDALTDFDPAKMTDEEKRRRRVDDDVPVDKLAKFRLTFNHENLST